MAVDVKVPAVGESIQEAMIHKWHKNSGDSVRRDEVLLELETDKATVELTAEADGILHILKPNGAVVAIGEVIGRLGEGKAGDGPAPVSASVPSPVAVPPPPKTSGVHGAATPGASLGSAPVATSASTPLSPAVRRIVTEEALDPGQISGSGKGGRITKGDALEAASAKAKGPSTNISTPQVPATPAPKSVTSEKSHGTVGQVQGQRLSRREPMSMLRRRIAERLVHAQNTAAILTTFNEVDMKGVMDLRKQYKDLFKERHGVNLGFMSFFVKAAVDALKKYPAINGWIETNDIVYHDYYDIGVAVSSERGLVVPILRDVDKLSMPEIEKAIIHYSTKARDNKISVDDLNGGTFTISNGGVFGSLLSTPILNPPQSAILGMHKIQERPVVVGGQIVIRPMMYLALSYDHRIVDGKEAVQFLVTIKELVEDPSRLLLGV
jgi:2-oxoglutarate dehydrogenase E2 component (dihydrolipoamide succinyltransferase)